MFRTTAGCANSVRRVVATLVLSLAMATPGWAQTASVSGVITDPAGRSVAGATVTATPATGASATGETDAAGRYRVDLAGAGPIRLEVRREGFAPAVVTLAVHGNATRDLMLSLAAVDDQVVVTASRVAERRATATESITVFTAAEVASLGATSLADVVRMTPGVNVESTGREGAMSSVFARGGESDYNHVLVDGVRVNTSGGQYDFGRVSAGEIERVEVVRGAQSALYGSDAIGSVVQVFTKRAGAGDPPQVSGAIEGGSFNTVRGNVSLLGGARGRIDYHAGVAYRGTDGAFSDRLPEPDRFDERSLNVRLGGIIGTRASVRGVLRRTDASGRVVGPIAFGARDRGTAYDSDDLSLNVDVSDRLTSRYSHRAALSYYRVDSLSADTIGDPSFNIYALLSGRPGALFPDGPRLVRLLDRAEFDRLSTNTGALPAGQFLATTPFGVSDFPYTSPSEFRRPAFKYQGDFDWLSGHTTTGGYEYERETDPLNPSFRIDNHAYYVQHQMAVADRWFIGAGARVNDNSRFGTEVSPKLSIGGFVRPYQDAALSSVKVFANIGRGIKNPTFFELFGSAYVDGNAGLHPERARTVDIGTEVTLDRQRWLARATYYDNRFNDQVAYRSTGFSLDGLPDYLNIDGSKASGWELEATLQRPIHGVTGGVSYWYTDTEVISFVDTSEQFQPGQPLLRRPRHAASARAAYANGPVTVSFNLRYAGERHDATFLGFSAIPSVQFPAGRSVDIRVNPAYTRVWVGADVRLHQSVTGFVRVDNLTDAEYQTVLGYPGLPRAVVVGARFAVGR